MTRSSEACLIGLALISSSCKRHAEEPATIVEVSPIGDLGLKHELQILAWGPTTKLAIMRQRAVDCGFNRAHIRPLTGEDRAILEKAKNAPSIGPDWVTLDAEEDITRHFPAYICYTHPHKSRAH